MTVLKAIVKNGKIELEAPNDWPEGTEVRIEPIPASGSVGIRDEDWPDTPEGIARHLALLECPECQEDRSQTLTRKRRSHLEHGRNSGQLGG
jgi:hypothetical protein